MVSETRILPGVYILLEEDQFIRIQDVFLSLFKFEILFLLVLNFGLLCLVSFFFFTDRLVCHKKFLNIQYLLQGEDNIDSG